MSNENEYIRKTYSLSQEVINMIKKISDYYGVNSSSAIRLSVLEIARQLGIKEVQD